MNLSCHLSLHCRFLHFQTFSFNILVGYASLKEIYVYKHRIRRFIIYICVYVCVCVLLFILMMHTESITITHKSLATVSLNIVSRKRRRQCTLKSYDRFTNKYDLLLMIRSDRKVFPSSSIGVLCIFWLSCLGPLVLLLANK